MVHRSSDSLVVGTTDSLIEGLGLYFEERATPTHVLFVAHSLPTAEYITSLAVPRMLWRAKLREGMIVSRARRTRIFGNGSSLVVMADGLLKNGAHRGLRVDKIFLSDQCRLSMRQIEDLSYCVRH